MNTKNRISKVVLLAGLVVASLNALPNTPPRVNPVTIESEKTIKDYFKFPQIVVPVNESQKVLVLFTTDQTGKVDFVLAKTQDQTLKAEIEKQFLKLNLIKLKSEVVHSVTLNIKTI